MSIKSKIAWIVGGIGAVLLTILGFIFGRGFKRADNSRTLDQMGKQLEKGSGTAAERQSHLTERQGHLDQTAGNITEREGVVGERESLAEDNAGILSELKRRNEG